MVPITGSYTRFTKQTLSGTDIQDIIVLLNHVYRSETAQTRSGTNLVCENAYTGMDSN